MKIARDIVPEIEKWLGKEAPNVERLLKVLEISDVTTFRKWHTLALDELIRKKRARENFWSRAFAVGDPDWLMERLAESGRKRMRVTEADGVSLAIGKRV